MISSEIIIIQNIFLSNSSLIAIFHFLIFDFNELMHICYTILYRNLPYLISLSIYQAYILQHGENFSWFECVRGSKFQSLLSIFDLFWPYITKILWYLLLKRKFIALVTMFYDTLPDESEKMWTVSYSHCCNLICKFACFKICFLQKLFLSR